jgi:adenine-specific DNA-methyltransferase
MSDKEKDIALSMINKLIKKFEQNIDQYKRTTYNEANTRIDFIDPFFEALGWDIANKKGRAEQYRNVVREDKVIILGKQKAPDYSFRIGGIRKYFIEAKKPSVNLKKDHAPAYQLRRYAYTAKLPLSILTDFEEFSVYDTRIKPAEKDSSSTARIFYCNYKDYIENFDFIYDTFSKDAILSGSFDRYIVSNKNKKGTSEVDKEFLKLINKWREKLAKNIAIHNNSLSIYELNFAVQKIIDRIIFIRISEDRQIEEYGGLEKLTNEVNTFSGLMQIFYNADKKYNSGLFNFDEDKITPQLNIDDEIIKDIISAIYYPKSPYEFSVFGVEILGNIYEQFLGQTVRLTPAHRVKIEEKPEVKKAGGIYYTPKYIVDYIVENTIGEIIKNKEPELIEKIKILDPSCGSGSFLLGAYQYLLDYHLDWYTKDNKGKKELKRGTLIQISKNNYQLSITEKQRILTNNIFGVDIDRQAVEVSKLSLLLKLLEGESQESAGDLSRYTQVKLLPDLSDNIKCGNSLIGTDYFSNTIPGLIDDKEIRRINPFDWKKEFPEIFKQGGFDAVIGNPPYVKEYINKQPFEDIKKTNMIKYYEGKMDLWYIFACKSIDLLKSNGLHSFIATNNWITNAGASKLRNKILRETRIIKFINFADFKVFENASIQTMIYVLRKENIKKPYKVKYTKILNNEVPITDLIDRLNYKVSKQKKLEGLDYEWFDALIDSNKIGDKTFTFVRKNVQIVLWKIKEVSNYKLEKNNVIQGIIAPQDFVIDKHLLKLKDKSIKKGNGIFILTTEEVKKLNLTNDERKIIKPYYTTDQLHRFWGDRNSNLWVIYSDINVRKNIRNYHNIKNHLDRFKNIITSDFKPYGLHRARNCEFFKGVKIISLRKTLIPHFTYTDFSCYVSQTYFVIKPNNINLKYLTGLLNSKLIYFWLYYKGKKQGDQLQIDKKPLLELPLIKPDFSKPGEKYIHDNLVLMADRMLNLQRKYYSVQLEQDKKLYKTQIDILDHQIDLQVYKLYSLTEEEIRIIEKKCQKVKY